MIVEFRQKGQVTIPREIVRRLNIKEGDKLEVTEEDGAIRMVPVMVCPADSILALKQELIEVKAQLEESEALKLEHLEAVLNSLR